jgi:hypothetical protein
VYWNWSGDHAGQDLRPIYGLAIPGEIVTTIVVKGLLDCDAAGAPTLTDCGRAVLRAMLPDL